MENFSFTVFTVFFLVSSSHSRRCLNCTSIPTSPPRLVSTHFGLAFDFLLWQVPSVDDVYPVLPVFFPSQGFVSANLPPLFASFVTHLHRHLFYLLIG
jgi:hypothetical protein